MRRIISVSLDHVTSVSTDTVPWQPFQQLKVVGASLPRIIKDGVFLSNDGFLFFDMHDPDKCITVSLNHERFKKIIFQVEDKENVAKTIHDALSK